MLNVMADVVELPGLRIDLALTPMASSELNVSCKNVINATQFWWQH